MGLFDKKYCDICGEKIGLLGNRKLEDGSLSKKCAGKLSPFFSERRKSTVDQIKAQLAYREENEQLLAGFHPTLTYGRGMKIFIDQAAQKFVVTRTSDWKAGNPDLISFSQVVGCTTEPIEHKEELFTKDANGNRTSYKPPRYQYTYEFRTTIRVDSPWFSEISFELSENKRPENTYTEAYHNYETDGENIRRILSGMEPASVSIGAMAGAALGNIVTPVTSAAPASGEVRRKFDLNRRLPYHYVKPEIGLDLDIAVTKISGEYACCVTDEARFRRTARSDYAVLEDKLFDALYAGLLGSGHPEKLPQEIICGAEFQNELNESLSSDWEALYGVRLIALAFSSVTPDPADVALIKKAEKDYLLASDPAAMAALLQENAQKMQAQTAAKKYWKCPICGGEENEGNICEYCGSPKPEGV